MTTKLLTTRMVALYLLGALFLPTFQPVFAANQRQIADVGLTSAGALVGQVVDHDGKPVANSPVAILATGQQPVQATTNDQGQFSVDRLPAGVYLASAPGTSQLVRVWAPRTAPPSASEGVLLVQSEATARAQNGHYGHEFLRAHWLKFAIAAGIAGGIVAIAYDDDAS